MTRTQRNSRSAPSGGKNFGNASQRRSQISRSLSKLLRHQAENERIPITKDGWVKVTDLLAWRGLRDLGRPGSPVGLEDVIDVVRDDGLHGKGRFGLKCLQDDVDMDGIVDEGVIGVDGATTGEVSDLAAAAATTTTTTAAAAATANHEPNKDDVNTQIPNEFSTTTVSTSKNSPETLYAISQYERNPNVSASVFLIRATQGHSIKAVESEGLLTPITLDDPSSIPETVVHGTFYGAWNKILSSGGLKSMSRNMIHFASGPTLEEMLPVPPTSVLSGGSSNPDDVDTTSEGVEEPPKPRTITTTTTAKATPQHNEKKIEAILSQNKVISGMRRDAQILIYIDLKRLLEDAQKNNWDMKWWRSDNGVILTEGVMIPTPKKTPPNTREDHVDDRSKEGDENPNTKLVPSSYFQSVVEIKAGLGLLFETIKEGPDQVTVQSRIVKDLPPSLSSKAMPRGKNFPQRKK